MIAIILLAKLYHSLFSTRMLRHISFPFVLAPHRVSLCRFDAKSTQRASVRDRKWRREGRSQRRQGERQLTKEGRREQSAWESCSEDTVSRRWRWEKESRPFKRSVSIPSGFAKISCKYSPALACKCTESCIKIVKNSLFLRLELTQVRVRLFFPPPSRLCFVRP